MKVCSTCQTERPVEEFYKTKRTKDGRLGQCKVCCRAKRREFYERHPGYQRKQYLAHRDKRLVQQREYRANLSPEEAEQRRHAKSEHAAKNRQKYREWKKKWRDANREYHREWERSNREAVRAYKRKSELKRRAKRRNLPVEDIDPQEIFQRDRGVCGICHAPVDPMDWHLDHIVPLALGGPHVRENVQVSHPCCNLSKGSRLAA